MKILIIDNYDSFTYNLVQLVRKITGNEPAVKRNDQFLLEEIAAYDKLLLSPGPGIPEEAGLLQSVIRKYGATKSILGVCLGHQAIGEVFGASLLQLKNVYHGIASSVHVTVTDPLFAGIPEVFTVGRYHSWTISREQFPDTLQVISEDDQGNIMAIRHKSYDVCGVQFHPESVLTDYGTQIISNWINS